MRFKKPRPWKRKEVMTSSEFKEKQRNLLRIARQVECINASPVLLKIDSPKKYSKKFKRREFPFLQRNVHKVVLTWDQYQTRLKEWSEAERLGLCENRCPVSVFSDSNVTPDEELKKTAHETESPDESFGFLPTSYISMNRMNITHPPTNEDSEVKLKDSGIRSIQSEGLTSSMSFKPSQKAFRNRSCNKNSKMELRCICKDNLTDMFMVQCFRCNMWQHGICIGLDVDEVPKRYTCDQCSQKQLEMRNKRKCQSSKDPKMTPTCEKDDHSISSSIDAVRLESVMLPPPISKTPYTATVIKTHNIASTSVTPTQSKNPATKKVSKSAKRSRNPKVNKRNDGANEFVEPVGVNENGDPLWAVDEVLNVKYVKRKKFYLVSWKGYPKSECSWEPAVNLAHAQNAIDKFLSTKKRLSKKKMTPVRDKKQKLDKEMMTIVSEEPKIIKEEPNTIELSIVKQEIGDMEI